MAATTAARDTEQSILDNMTGHEPMELKVLSALGTLRFAPAPLADLQEPECELPAAPPLHILGLPAPPPPETIPAPAPVYRTARHGYISPRWYDLSFAVLILISGVVALYRLIWMGQP